jgi:hypothetical protein
MGGGLAGEHPRYPALLERSKARRTRRDVVVPSDNESPEEICAQIASTVDEHHGEYSQDPPWSEIKVYSAMLSPALRAVLVAIGASEFESTPDGFLCRRPSPS